MNDERKLIDRRENLGLALARRADRSPSHEALAIVGSGLRLSWADLDARANRTANALATLGVGTGDRVALLLMNGPEIFESVMAIAKLGAVAVPMNWRLVADELAFLLSDSGARCLIFGQDFDAAAADLFSRGAEGTSLKEWLRVGESSRPEFAKDYDELQAGASSEAREVTAWGNDPVLILYTSGTTGLPKGALHSHRTVIMGAIAFGRDFEIRRLDRYLLFMPAFHVGALAPWLACIHAGATCVVMESFDAAQAWSLIARERITNFIAVPSMLRELLPALDDGSADASSVRWIMTGAAPIPASLLTAYQQRGIEITSAYGLTEAFGGGCVLASEEAAARIGSVGKPFYFFEGRVVDEAGRDCKPGQPGEILLRSPSVMLAYWNRPEATAETLRDGWLHTGDIAVLDEDGFYSIKDRIKDMLISGGENVYPAEIENVLHGHPGIADVAVIGQPSERWGESAFAVIVRADPDLDAASVLDYCQGRMARFKQPKGIAFVAELPRNPSGKLLKFELRERFPGPAPE